MTPWIYLDSATEVIKSVSAKETIANDLKIINPYLPKSFWLKSDKGTNVCDNVVDPKATNATIVISV